MSYSMLHFFLGFLIFTLVGGGHVLLNGVGAVYRMKIDSPRRFVSCEATFFLINGVGLLGKNNTEKCKKDLVFSRSLE